MVPERTRIRGDETVFEGRSRRDWRLGQLRHAVHCVGETHAVPMDQRWDRQLVHESHVDLAAALDAQQRPRNGVVVVPYGGRWVSRAAQLGGATAGYEAAEAIDLRRFGCTVLPACADAGPQAHNA